MTEIEKESTEEHIVEGIEPCWVEVEYDLSGSHVIMNETEPISIIDGMLPDVEYECSCGEEFESWDRMIEHHREVRDP